MLSFSFVMLNAQLKYIKATFSCKLLFIALTVSKSFVLRQDFITFFNFVHFFHKYLNFIYPGINFFQSNIKCHYYFHVSAIMHNTNKRNDTNFAIKHSVHKFTLYKIYSTGQKSKRFKKKISDISPKTQK